jgi:hypothetical protein
MLIRSSLFVMAADGVAGAALMWEVAIGNFKTRTQTTDSIIT